MTATSSFTNSGDQAGAVAVTETKVYRDKHGNPRKYNAGDRVSRAEAVQFGLVEASGTQAVSDDGRISVADLGERYAAALTAAGYALAKAGSTAPADLQPDATAPIDLPAPVTNLAASSVDASAADLAADDDATKAAKAAKKADAKKAADPANKAVDAAPENKSA